MDQSDQFLDIQQTFFVWYRADGGYYLDDMAYPAPKEKSRDGSPFLIATPETGGFAPSEILKEERDLFLEFASVAPTPEKVLAFADAYGPLTDGIPLITPTYSFPKGRPEIKPWKHDVDMMSDYGTQREYGTVWGESLHLWVREIRNMALTVQLWEWVQDKDKEALDKVIYWRNNDSKVYYVLAEKEILDEYGGELAEGNLRLARPFHYNRGLVATNIFNQEMFERFKRGDPYLPAQYLLQFRINKKVEEHVAGPRLLMNEHNQLAPYILPDNLLGAMWLQFLQTASGEKSYRRCAICGQWESMEGKTRRWTRHLVCANRDRVRRSKAKKAALTRPPSN